MPPALLLLVPLFLAGSPHRAAAQPLTLRQAVDEALKAHPALRAADGELRAEEGRRLQALSPPPLEYTWHEEEIPVSGRFGDGGQTFHQLAQGFDIPLLTGARARTRARFVEAAAARRELTALDVRAEVLTAYAALHAAERRQALYERRTALAAEFAEKSRRRADVGDATPLEAARVAALHASARAEEARGSYDLALARTALARALGRPEATGLLTADTLPEPSFQAFETEGAAPGDATAHPAVRAAAGSAEGYRGDAARQWMEWLPAFRAAAFRQDIAGMGRYWGAELTVTVPLWFLLDARGRGEEAAGLAMQAEAARALTELDIRARQSVAAAAVEAARTELAAYAGPLLREAGESLRAAGLAYRNGAISYLEFIDAQRGAYDILLGFHDALARAWAAAAEAERAAGRPLLDELP